MATLRNRMDWFDAAGTRGPGEYTWVFEIGYTLDNTTSGKFIEIPELRCTLVVTVTAAPAAAAVLLNADIPLNEEFTLRFQVQDAYGRATVVPQPMSVEARNSVGAAFKHAGGGGRVSDTVLRISGTQVHRENTGDLCIHGMTLPAVNAGGRAPPHDVTFDELVLRFSDSSADMRLPCTRSAPTVAHIPTALIVKQGDGVLESATSQAMGTLSRVSVCLCGPHGMELTLPPAEDVEVRIVCPAFVRGPITERLTPSGVARFRDIQLGIVDGGSTTMVFEVTGSRAAALRVSVPLTLTPSGRASRCVVTLKPAFGQELSLTHESRSFREVPAGSEIVALSLVDETGGVVRTPADVQLTLHTTSHGAPMTTTYTFSDEHGVYRRVGRLAVAMPCKDTADVSVASGSTKPFKGSFVCRAGPGATWKLVGQPKYAMGELFTVKFQCYDAEENKTACESGQPTLVLRGSGTTLATEAAVVAAVHNRIDMDVNRGIGSAAVTAMITGMVPARGVATFRVSTLGGTIPDLDIEVPVGPGKPAVLALSDAPARCCVGDCVGRVSGRVLDAWDNVVTSCRARITCTVGGDRVAARVEDGTFEVDPPSFTDAGEHTVVFSYPGISDITYAAAPGLVCVCACMCVCARARLCVDCIDAAKYNMGNVQMERDRGRTTEHDSVNGVRTRVRATRRRRSRGQCGYPCRVNGWRQYHECRPAGRNFHGWRKRVRVTGRR